MSTQSVVNALGNKTVLRNLETFSKNERRALADLLVHLAEAEERRLYAAQGYSTLFNYCVEELGFSENEATLRIQMAKAARRYPRILALIGEGRLAFSSVSKLLPHLNEENHSELLEAASGKSTREIEKMIAHQFPTPSIRERMQPLSDEAVLFEFCGSPKFANMVSSAQKRLQHKYPHGKIVDILSEALASFLSAQFRKQQHQRRSLSFTQVTETTLPENNLKGLKEARQMVLC